MAETKLIRIYERDEARIKAFGAMGDTFPVAISRVLDLAEKYKNQISEAGTLTA